MTEEQLSHIEKLAGLFYTPREIAIMLSLPLTHFVAQCELEESPVYQAYWRGYYEADMQYREDVKLIAHLGSSPAQTLLGKIIETRKSTMHDR